MSAEIQPKGEKLRQAVRWIAAERLADETRGLAQLIQQASFRYNLSPKDELFLQSFYGKEGSPPPGPAEG
jgi:hypothetical protein